MQRGSEERRRREEEEREGKERRREGERVGNGGRRRINEPLSSQKICQMGYKSVDSKKSWV